MARAGGLKRQPEVEVDVPPCMDSHRITSELRNSGLFLLSTALTSPFPTILLRSGILGGLIKLVRRPSEHISDRATMAHAVNKPCVEPFAVGAAPFLLSLGPYPLSLFRLVVDDPGGRPKCSRQLGGAHIVELDIIEIGHAHPHCTASADRCIL